MGSEHLTFGPFELLDGTLRRGDKPLILGQRALALLVALARTDGPVSKAALMEAGWPSVTVEEGNLTVQISVLRKALGQRDDGQDWIVTVPRVGYLLIRKAAASAASAAIPLVAVLPFQNIGKDAEQQYFADGMVEEIIMALSRFKSFAVVSRNSCFAYRDRAVDVRDAARELGVRYVLEGSVRRGASTLRTSAQLVDGETGTQLWSNRYEGHVEDVFAVQDEIVESVAVVLEPEIQRAEILRSRRDRPASAAAYDLYLRGLHALDVRTFGDNAEAFALFDRAAVMEPENGTYLIYAAWTIAVARAMGWPAVDTTQRQVELAHRAVEVSPNDGNVLARATMILIHGSREYELAEILIARALEANPNSFWVLTCAGIFHIHCGDLEQALQHFGRVAELSPNDPNSSTTLTGVAHVYMVMGRYAEALNWAERSLAANRSHSATYWMLVAGNALLGRLDLARRYLAALIEVAPQTTLASIRAGQPSKISGRIEPILEGLRLAGLPEK